MGKNNTTSGVAPVRYQNVIKLPKQPPAKKPVGRPRVAPRGVSPFGPVATIDTAPVAIGNSISGANPVVVPTKDGLRIKGRDFLCNVDATVIGITGWTLTAGSPISPVCMVSSALKGFVNTYAEYYIHGVAFHYITATTTAEPGSICMYINKNRGAPCIPTDGTTFLPTILSDHNTCLSPLWKNTSSVFLPASQWFSTDLFSDEGLHEQAPGELFVFTKSSLNVPSGYILVDYDISFRNMQANPKALTLPIARMKYTQVRLFVSGNLTQNNVVQMVVTNGTLMDGSTASAAPPGTQVGDIYKVIMNLNDATFVVYSASTFLRHQLNANSINVDINMTDSFTCYAVFVNASTVNLFPSYALACTGINMYILQTTQSSSVVGIPAYMSLVGSVDGALLQAAI